MAGLVRGCGGGEADRRAWVTAVRSIRHAARAPRLKIVGERPASW
ncbi:hypothetical protein [Actinomadura yumaensis]|uniref:PH domain-containing protein n=1 Tax=Actinomadura yumaensis TaxID=111807 RepID=A0ABW2CEK1_9ACTN